MKYNLNLIRINADQRDTLYEYGIFQIGIYYMFGEIDPSKMCLFVIGYGEDGKKIKGAIQCNVDPDGKGPKKFTPLFPILGPTRGYRLTERDAELANFFTKVADELLLSEEMLCMN